ncbi:MAG: PBP1A family penicillin-binding protein [Candidatus Eremiobacterota bacterium]
MASRRREKKRSGCGGCLRFLWRLFVACFLLGLVAGLFGFAFAYRMLQELSVGLPDVKKLDSYEPAETTRIYAADGTLIATLFQENRTYVTREKISPHVIHALLAIEDTRFYEHHGVDFRGVARAVYVDLTHRGRREGASTITMQLARNLFLTNEPSMRRKVQEAILATRIEKAYSKDKILELYLNQVYFGAGAYGIAAAASLYREKKAEQLNPAEAAVIVGLLQAPSAYSPLVNPDAARRRAKLVLGRMHEVGFLSSGEHASAVAEVDLMKFPSHQEDRQFQMLKYPYFTTYVIQELSQRYPEEVLYRSGLRIHTTLDIQAQREAERILREEVHAAAYDLNVDSGALVLVENQTGYLRAMVGGTGWTPTNQFNRAWQALRQPGSSFKVIVYAAALEAGYTPDTEVDDSRVSYRAGGVDWTPKNSDGAYMGRITLRAALQFSRNVVAVKLMSELGIDPVIALAYRMGIRQELRPNLSLALGATEVTPLEMAEVFSVVANGGLRRHPTAIKMVQDSKGNVVEDHRRPREERAVDAYAAATLTDMLMSVVTGGTGTGAQVPGYPIAGKTGTTDSFRDAWFCGFSAQYTLAVWVGNNDNSPMWRSYGGDLPAAIFRRVMGMALQGKPVVAFPKPSGPRTASSAGSVQQPESAKEIRVRVCSETGLLAIDSCPGVAEKLFKFADAPREVCQKHRRDLPRPADTGSQGVPDGTSEWVDDGTGVPAQPQEPAPPPPPADWVDEAPPPVSAPTPVEAVPEQPGGQPTPVDEGAF